MINYIRNDVQLTSRVWRENSKAKDPEYFSQRATTLKEAWLTCRPVTNVVGSASKVITRQPLLLSRRRGVTLIMWLLSSFLVPLDCNIQQHTSSSYATVLKITDNTRLWRKSWIRSFKRINSKKRSLIPSSRRRDDSCKLLIQGNNGYNKALGCS